MARDLSGTGQYLSNASAGNYTTQAFSASFWIHPDAVDHTSPERTILWKGAFNTNGWYIQLGHTNSGDIGFVTSQSSANQITRSSTGAISTTGYQHVLITRSGSTGKIYINGAEVSYGTSATHINPASSSSNFTVGRYDTLTSGYIDGRIAEVALWSSALSLADAVALAKGYSPSHISPATLNNYWPLVGRTDPEIDITGNQPLSVTGAIVYDHPRVIQPVTRILGSPFSANIANIPQGTLTLTGYAPTFNDGYSTANIPQGTLTLTGYAPTFLDGNEKTFTIPQGELTLTGYAPDFVVSEYNIANIPQGALTLTGNAPTFSYTTAPIAVEIASQSSLNAYTPAIVAGINGQSELNAYQAVQVGINSQSTLPAYQTPVVDINGQAQLLAYQPVDVQINSQSAIPVYQSTQVDILAQNALTAYSTAIQTDVIAQSAINAISAVQVDITAESNLPVYQTPVVSIAGEAQLLAYELTLAAINSQSALSLYHTTEAAIMGQSAFNAYGETQQVELIAASALQAYEPTQATIHAQSANTVYAYYTTQTLAQADLKAYEPWLTAIIGQSSILSYWTTQVAVNAQAALNSAYTETVVGITGQANLKAYESQQVDVYSQSALPIYQTSLVNIIAVSALSASYTTTQVNLNGQSALAVYADTLTTIISQSALNIYEVTLVEINAQSALAATEKFYAWVLNLNTGAVSKFDNYNFNSLSGNLGANENGIFTLTGTSDNGTAIAGFIETGKKAFNKDGLCRVTDAYIGMKGGALKLTLTTENTGAIPYTTGVTTQLKTEKLNLARGAKGKYWTAKIENVAGSQAQIDEMTLLVEPIARRI
jgi:hypothetical protein